MRTLGEVLSRLIVVLVETGVIEEERAEWILQPLKDKFESKPQESEDKDK